MLQVFSTLLSSKVREQHKIVLQQVCNKIYLFTVQYNLRGRVNSKGKKR